MSRPADDRIEVFVLTGALAAVALPGVYNILKGGNDLHAWYAGSTLPAFAVPFGYGAFGWTCAFVAMAFAVWLAWREAGWPSIKQGAALWVATLACGQLWAFAMLFLHRPGWALPLIAATFAGAAACAWIWRRVSRPAALLMLAVLAWTGYAGLVNFGMWLLNR